MAILFTLITFFSTLAGGLISLKFKNRMNLLLGLTSGVLLGVVAFDILPQIIELTHKLNVDPTKPMLALVFGFLIFHIVEKYLVIRHSHEGEYASHQHPHIGMLSALALFGCSFLDGVGIGFGFQVSQAIGIFVALAVIAHDASDGINTVSLMLAHHNTQKRAVQFLVMDALVPTMGALSTVLFKLPESWLLLYLGYFAGFLIYIGASDILPQAHSQKSTFSTVATTIAGTAFIFLVSRIIG